MLVEVRPIDVKKWHGKTGKDSFTQPKGIEVLLDTATGKYATGLSEEDVKKYSAILGVDLSDTFNPEEPHPYWGTQAARIKLPNQTMIFDTSKPSDYVKVKNLKASKFIANSLKDLNEGNCPEAEFVIFDEQEEMEVKASKIQKRNKCVKVLSSLTADQKVDIVQILSKKSIRNRSQDFIDVEIDAIINSDPDGFLKYVNMDKAETYIRAAILEGVNKNVLQKEGNAIFYMGDKIANDYEECVTMFLDPQNSKLKVSLLEKIKT
jgi:hypothetical protein